VWLWILVARMYDSAFGAGELLALCSVNPMELERGLRAVFTTRLTMNGWIRLSQCVNHKLR
jgi:hypothetical protein